MADVDNREERIRYHQEELQRLVGETAGEVNETLSEAEQEVTEVAEAVQEEAATGAESVDEAATQIESTVEETATEAAEELGHPELAGQIADHLMSRLEERGLLQHTHGHAEVVEAAPVETPPAEAPAEAPVDPVETPPEPQHWWYRPRGRR